MLQRIRSRGTTPNRRRSNHILSMASRTLTPGNSSTRHSRGTLRNSPTLRSSRILNSHTLHNITRSSIHRRRPALHPPPAVLTVRLTGSQRRTRHTQDNHSPGLPASPQP
jgi:hypothetical protein